MRKTKQILLLLLIPMLCFATGMSWAIIKINPVAETDQGELVCKWVSQMNLSGASSASSYNLGWIVVSSQGIIYEFQCDTLDRERVGLSEDERVKLTNFTAPTLIEQIPPNVQEKLTGNISIVEHRKNFYKRTSVPCDSIFLLKDSPSFYTIKGLQSDDYSEIIPVSTVALYSRNGIELKTSYLVDGYLNEFCSSFTLNNHSILNASFLSKENIDIFEIDAFIFSNKK